MKGAPAAMSVSTVGWRGSLLLLLWAPLSCFADTTTFTLQGKKYTCMGQPYTVSVTFPRRGPVTPAITQAPRRMTAEVDRVVEAILRVFLR